MEDSFMSAPQLDDPDLPLADLMKYWPQTLPVFIRHGMLCVGCLIAPFHTVLDACVEYGLDEARFRAELFDAVSR
ncbi:DUF1858 domain-containing protein [Roseovarius aquimarinus]|uniref:DUF1858 domain-containing protein n=1 Tax=Roseovarius aquimarinus TaxID=1229156 RepID=A0ABW7IDM0_9RHOB